MSKAIVNMTPNPLDIQTIHCSQGDTEAREWEFELHNNGELIDTSEITEQLFFKAYKGGTEQILPENGSTPTTSPFIGDIKYPQGILSDQEFLYRESPTEEDGLAKITDIKGNTLVWNQISIVPFTEVRGGVTFTRSGDRTTLQMSGTSTSTIYKPFSDIPKTIVGHVYYVDKGADSTLFQLYNDNGGISTETDRRRAIGRATAEKSWYFRIPNGTTLDVTAKPMIMDLTQMFGAGNEPSTVEEFTSLFPLSYYAYNQGTLLSFNGNGIKTTGKNLLMPSTVTWSDVSYVDGYYDINVTTNAVAERRLFGDWGIQNAVSLGLISGTYIWTTERLGINTPAVSVRVSVHGTENYVAWSPNTSRYINADDKFFILLYFGSAGTYNGKIGIQLQFGSSATSYEPYTSSTLSLPISTYFPNGMDGVGADYDELTNTKATTRMTRVDLGSLNWNRMTINEGYAFVSNEIADMIPTGNVTTANVLCPPYTLYMSGNGYSMANDKTFRVGGTYFGTRRVIIRDDTYTDATAFKSAMSGVYLVYPLATPTEVTFSTASLVTENAEIPLSNDDGILIGKCTEQLSSESGFFDAKIKLADEDGECYSNKIQLHVERSPQ